MGGVRITLTKGWASLVSSPCAPPGVSPRERVGSADETRDGRTNVRTLAVSQRVLAFEACSARPALKVLR